MKTRIKYLGLLFFGLLVLFSSPAFGKVEVIDIRHWTAPDHTRIVLDLNQPSYYDIFELKDPDRLVIDLKNARSRLKE